MGRYLSYQVHCYIYYLDQTQIKSCITSCKDELAQARPLNVISHPSFSSRDFEHLNYQNDQGTTKLWFGAIVGPKEFWTFQPICLPKKITSQLEIRRWRGYINNSANDGVRESSSSNRSQHNHDYVRRKPSSRWIWSDWEHAWLSDATIAAFPPPYAQMS